MLAEVAPLLQAYVYGVVPPVAETVAPASLAPLQLGLLLALMFARISPGELTVVLPESVQPLASVTVTV